MAGDDRKQPTPGQRRAGIAIGLTIVIVMFVAGAIMFVKGGAEVVDTYRFNAASDCGSSPAGGCISSLLGTVTPIGFDPSSPPFGGVSQKVHISASGISRDIDLRQGTSIDQVNPTQATAEVWHGHVTALIIAGKRVPTTRVPRYVHGGLFAVIGALLLTPGVLVLVGLLRRMARPSVRTAN